MVGEQILHEEEEYRRHAAKCLKMAEETTDPFNRSSLISIAYSWLRLAEMAEKNSHTDVSYETPAQRQLSSH
jgi:hypothetical protein